MRVKLSLDRLAGRRVEWTLEVERTSASDMARLAEGDAARYRAALDAITHAGQLEAHAIATAALS